MDSFGQHSDKVWALRDIMEEPVVSIICIHFYYRINVVIVSALKTLTINNKRGADILVALNRYPGLNSVFNLP